MCIRDRTDAAAKGSALGQGNKFYDVFGQDMTTGNPMGGAINPIAVSYTHLDSVAMA